MFSIKKSAMSEYILNTGTNLNPMTNWSPAGKEQIQNFSPKTSFQNIKTGDVFNLFESMVLNSKWDVRDSDTGSTVVLSREHMFYEKTQNEKTKLDKIIENNDFSNFSLSQTPVNLFSYSSKVLVENGITQGFDQTTEAVLKKTNQNLEEENLIDILNREKIRKFSETHFVLNGFNLIYSDIKINEDVYNTISYNYEKDSDKTVMVTLIPENNSRNMREVNLSPPYHICDFAENGANLNRNVEYFENMLLKNLENAYTGKIFMKYNSEIELEDKIVLIDNINSTVGMFRVDTYEHRFTQDGLCTVVNVKACVSISDPTLDVYSQSYLMKLHNDLKEEIDSGENIVFRNIFSTIAKIMYQLPKYGAFYHREDKWFSSNEYPVKDNNARANSLPLKFIPLLKKGKAHMPENIESCFFSTDLYTQSFISAFLKNIALSVRGMFQDGRDFALGTIRYTLDFLISMPTFGLHELLKPAFGLQYKKMMETFENKKLSGTQINIIKDNENFYSSGDGALNPTNYKVPEKNIDYTISFFNMKAQTQEGLFHYKNDESKKQESAENLKEKIERKEQVSNMIVNHSCDTMFAVEVYENFKIDKLNYTSKNFLENVFGGNDRYIKHEINQDSYNGKEYGIIYSQSIEKYKKYFKSDSYTVDIGDKRKAVISTMDIEEFGFKEKTIINTIKFIWLHNYYGSKPDSIKERIEIFQNVLRTGNELRAKDPALGIIIVGDFNLQIDNDRVTAKTTASSTNQNVVITREKDGFISCIDKPTTLSSTSGSNFVNRFDNVLISSNLEFFYKRGNIKANVNKYYAPLGVDRRDISDHIPVQIHLKKNKN